MARVTIEINTDSDAFQGRDNELARILEVLADDALNGDIAGLLRGWPIRSIRDINGNSVGTVKVSPEYLGKGK